MKTLFEARYKKPGRKCAQAISIATEKSDLAYVESELAVEIDGKQYSGFRMLVLFKEPDPESEP